MIRPIRPGDVPAVLELVRELAEFEMQPDAVHSTADDLHRALFADRATVHAHVAVEPQRADTDDGVVGAAIWYVTFSTWTGRHGIHLLDLVVSSRARGRGHGQALFGELIRICTERGYARLEWDVLDALADRSDRTAPHGFYRHQGGSPRQGWTTWRMDAAALAHHAPG